jgi:PAS domain S-box-containing protein
MDKIINVFSRMGFWPYVLFFTILAIIISEILIIAQSYWLTGGFFDRNLLIVGFITPAVDAFIVFTLSAFILRRLAEMRDASNTLRDELLASKKEADQALEALERERAKYKAMLEFASDGLFIMDLHTGALLEYSKVVPVLLGYTPEELKRITVLDWDKAIESTEHFREIIRPVGYEPVHFERTHTRKDGSTYIAAVSAVKFTLNGEEFLYSSVRDITEQKENEQKLLQQKEEFETIFKTSKDGIAVLDLDSNFIDFNDAYMELAGFTRAELLKKSCIGMSRPEDIPKSVKVMGDVLKNGFVKNFEKTCIRKNGSLVTVNMSLALMPNRKNILITAKDVTQDRELRDALTESKQHNEALLKDQKALLSLFDKGDSVLFKWNNDAHWSIEYVSDNVGGLIGHSKEAFMNGQVNYSDCIHTEDLSHVRNEVRQLSLGQTDYLVHDPYRIHTKNGEEKWILDYTIAERDDTGKITHFIGYINDITQQKLFEKELVEATRAAEQASQSKSAFLANMSHEIRTPMNAILGFVEQLSKTEPDAKRQQQFGIIKNSGQQLLNIINDILDLSKIESGKMDIDSHPCQSRDLYDSTCQLFADMMQQKQIAFSPLMSKEVPECIMTDDVRLKQVIFNLLSNAVKFTPERGEIRFDMGYHANRLHVSIADTGVGIAEENLEKIFDAFDQEDSSTTRRFGGTGLGLSISSKLVQMMGGVLSVESTLGSGSRFYFDIPVPECEVESSDDGTDVQMAPALESGGLNGHILVVEDNKTNQMLMGIILDDAGVTYDVADNGVEGVAMFKEKTYDAILMDENMPEMNGIEATKHIRQLEVQHGTHVPIIAVTANALAQDRKRFMDAGMDDYISKPYTEEEIINMLTRYFSTPEAEH